MLYGVTTLQTYVYYTHYSEDSSCIKFVVAAVWILDTLHVSFMCHVLYYYLITNYGDLLSLEYIIWSFPASLLVNTFIVTIVQFFFAHTIYCLCRHQLRWLVTAPLISLVLVHFGLAIAIVFMTFVNDALSFSPYTRFYTATPTASTIVLSEVLITVSLYILLRDSGSRSAVPSVR